MTGASEERVPASLEENVASSVCELLGRRHSRTPFHGLHHLFFVRDIATIASEELGAKTNLVRTAAMVHDLNYLFAREGGEEEAKVLRRTILTKAGAPKGIRDEIERVVWEASSSRRCEAISLEAKALSDGDTAFKALPVVPLMSVLYLLETGKSIEGLSQKVVKDQMKPMDDGVYFYSKSVAGDFLKMGIANLEMWNRVDQFLKTDLAGPLVSSLDESVDALRLWWLEGPGRPAGNSDEIIRGS